MPSDADGGRGHTNRRRFLRATGALTTAGLVAGCSGEPGAPRATATPVGGGDNPVRIGASLPYAGFMRDEGIEMYLGMDFWREQVNANGGLLGRPVEFVVYDDESTTAGGAAAYRRLLAEDVDLLMGTAGTLATAGAIDVLEAAQVPCLFPMSWGPMAWDKERRWTVPLLPIAGRVPYGLVQALDDLGLRSFAIVRSSSGYARDLTKGLKRHLQNAGIEIVADVTYQEGDPAARRKALQKVRGSGADVVGGGGSVAEVKPLIRLAADMEFEAEAFAWFDFDDTRIMPLAAQAEGMLGTGIWTARARFPGNETFVDRFAEWAARRKPDWPRTRILQHHSPAAYAGAQVLQRAVEEADSFDHEAVRDALWNLEVPTVAGTYRVDDDGYQVGKRLLVVQYQRRVQEVVWPPDLRTAEPTLSAIGDVNP